MPVKIAVVTVSDRCSAGQATDESGPLAVRLLSELVDPQTSEAPTIVTALVPDEIAQIQNVVMRFADIEGCNLVVTTGGTGFAVRDVTPEAITPLLTKQAPGLMHAITSNGLSKTPFAWLSRGVAGVRNSTVIFTLPGSKKAVQEGLEPLIGKGLYHALELARGVAESPHPSALNPARDHKDSSLTEPIRVPDPTTRARQSEYPMITMTEALAAIEQYTPAPKCTSVHTAAATGLVLAEPVTAAFPQPPFRASVKDGYAVLSADGPGVYRVTGSLCAGSTVPAGYLLKAGETCRVNTGGPIPSNADAVVQVEDTELLATEGSQEVQIRVKVRVSAGHDIRAIGCDMETGGVAVEAGSVIGPAEVGLALSVGATSVKVYRKPCVAVLSTGDELAPIPSVASHQSLPPPVDKIYDSNRGMLIAAAAEHASKVVDAGIARDEMNDTRRKLEAAFANADIVISTGGVSMGEVDCVKAVLLEMGATIHFGRVNMKPGKPTTFASLNGKLFFALPGNPVSAMVCFYVFVVPSLLRWRGSSTRSLPLVRAQLTHDVKLDKERPEYHRCHLTFSQESHFTATSTGIQASHRLLSLAGANGLMVLPAAQDGLTSIARGQTISVVVIGPIRSTLLS